MGDLAFQLSNYIQQAKSAMAIGDYDKAHDLFLRAAQCTLLLAKGSVGAAREKYLANYSSIKELLKQLEKKKTQSNANTFVNNNTNAGEVNTSSSSVINDNKNAPQKTDAPKPQQRENNNYQKPNNDSLSPQWLSDYIGQPQAVTAVRDLITAARLKNSAMPHIILYGSHGLGKSTFSRIIANEMRANFMEVNVSKITPAEMIAILKKIQSKDILFIDEIHTLPLVVAESILYSAMQDGRITYTEGKGATAHTETMTLPPFTLIGATTEIGKLAKPFIQRAIQVRLEEYSDEVLSGIIANSFYKLGMKISTERALYIAKRCRNNPRVANSMVKRISDKALVRFASMNNFTSFGSLGSVDAIRQLGIEVTEKVIDEFFEENGIDKYGLEKGDRDLMKLIIERYDGGPVGIDTLARAMNESNNVLSQKYEAYLIKKGMLRIDRDGRVIMPEGYRALGLPVPAKLLEETGENTQQNKENNEEKNSRFEKRKMVACKVVEDLKCQKIEELIVYPPSVRTATEDLDTLFPEVEKPVVEDPQHRCELEIDFDDFTRTLICDSFLESRFARCLAGVGYVKDIKAQTLEIPYISHALANRRYFPDFVIRDYKDRIAVIEMKNFNMLSYHLNLDKYEQLRRYCEDKGYGYAEIAKEFNAEEYTSLEQLRVAPINRALEEYIIQTIENNEREKGEGAFTESDLEAYSAQYGKVDRKEIYTILINNRRLKNIDRAGDNMRIVLN